MSVVTPFPHPRVRQAITSFDRLELQRILDLYGRMVAAGHWRDYGLSFHPDVAIFAAFRRTAERPEARIGFAMVSEHGVVLKRGHDLHGVLAPLERRLMRLVGE